MNRWFIFGLVFTIALGTAAGAMAFPWNDSWHTAAWGDVASVRGEAGGIYGTGGRSDNGIRCSHCHTDDRLGLCTDPMTGAIDFDMTVSPAFGSTADGEDSYAPGRTYRITITLTGEHRGHPGENQNGMAATIEDASGRVVGRFITDSGADSASCTPGLPPGIGTQDGRGTTFVTVWRASDPTFRREQLAVGANASLVIVASPREIWSLGYTLGYVGGYQASPYRFARLRGSDNLPFYLSMPETHPEQRWRHALVTRWNVLVSDDAALRSHARIYVDDWGVASLTLGTELRASLGNGVEFGGLVRVYGLLGVAFYRDVYERPMRYMTSDRELSPFIDAFIGPRLAWRSRDEGPFGELRFEA